MAYSWLSRVVPSPRVPEEALGVVLGPEQVLHRLGLYVLRLDVVGWRTSEDVESVRAQPTTHVESGLEPAALLGD